MEIPTVMSGIRLEEPGDTSKLQWRDDVPVPTLGKGEILIRNEFAGVNFMDTHFRSGRYPASYPLVLGGEGAGTVISVHSSVSDQFKFGDRVAYLAKGGAYAQYSAMPTTRVVHLPDTVSFDIAAASLAQGLTALTLSEESHAVKPGEKVLIHGASGGVGSLLVQMCKAKGATIIGTVSTKEKAEVVQGLGADFVINTSKEDWVARVKEITNTEGVNAIFDPVGQATFDGDLEAIARKGTVVCFGNVSGKIPPLDVLKLGGTKNVKLCYPTVFAYLTTRAETQAYADELFEMVQERKAKMEGLRIYSLREVGKAHGELEGRKSVGKIVLKIP